MKLLMMIVDEAKKEELEVVLSNTEGVMGFTEIPHTVGSGSSGLRLGSRTFPKTSAVIFTMVAASAEEGLVAAIKEYCVECKERLKMISWGVEEVL